MSAALVAGVPSDRPRTVLVVEDDVLIRAAAAQFLRGSGFMVLEAVHADEALDIVRSAQVDVVFSDVKLPGSRNGVDLAQVIRTDHPEVKVLLTSGVRPYPDMEGVTLVKKPYFLFEVERQIRALLQARPKDL
jgi:CheY-like chemotaxis protein